MTTTIYLIRHGQTEGNHKRVFQGRIDTPLNEVGKAQILKTCQFLVRVGIQWDVLVTSPLTRALQTTEILKSFFPNNKPTLIEERVIERAFGDAEGVALTQENYRKIMKNQFENLESETEIISRAQNFLNDLQDKYPGKIIIIVTHSHFIKACLKPHLKNIEFDTKTLNGGVSILKFNEFKRCLTARIDINKE